MLKKNEKEANRISRPSMTPSGALQKMAHTLGERVKELNCVYEISNIAEKPDISLDETLQSIVNLIPSACQYPQITCAHITLGKQVFASGKSKRKPTQWKLTREIRLCGKRIGEIQIWHLKKMPKVDRGAFMKEEKYLLNVITERVGRIIERTQAKELLRAGKAQLQFVTDHAPVMIAHYDHERHYKFVNKSYAEMFGLRVADMLGKHPRDVLGKEAYAFASPHMATALAGQTIEYDLMLPATAGGLRAVHVKYAPEHDASGRVIGFVAAVTDITERKQAEEDLKDSEGRFKAIFENVSDGLILADSQSRRFFNANNAMCEMLGYSLEEIRHLAVEDIHYAEDMPYIVEQFEKAVKKGEYNLLKDLRFKRKDGSLFYADIKPFELSYAGRKIRGAVVRDITGRKQAEMEKIRQRQDLAHRERVVQMGELASTLAHEINQPLTGILGNAQAGQRFLAGDKPDLGEIRNILADIVADGKRAGKVISQVRLFLRDGESSRELIDINGLIRDTQEFLSSDLILNRIVLVTEFCRDLPAVFVDRVQCQQVLINLISNAEKAMGSQAKEEERRLVISTAMNASGQVAVSVRDTGTGVAQKDIERIFAPFYHKHRRGMGMGLSICRTIVQAHGGKIWAENNPGRGARFIFTLPVVVAEKQVRVKSGTGKSKRKGKKTGPEV